MENLKHTNLILAEKIAEEGNFEEAFELVNRTEKENNLNDNDQLFILLLKSSLLLNLSQFDEGFIFAEKALQKSKKLGLTLFSVDASILKGQLLTRLQKLEEAFEMFLQAENLLKNIHPDLQKEYMRRKASIQVGKSFIYFYSGDGDNALLQLEESLKLREELGNKKEIIESLSFLGNVYTFYKGKLELSLKCAERCQDLIKEVNVKSVRFPLAMNLVNFGNIYFHKGELDHALKYYEDSLSILEELKDYEYITAVLSNISNIYLEKGEIEQTLDNYLRVLHTHEKIGNPWYISGAYSNLIELLTFTGDIPQAKTYLEKFQKYNSQVKNDYVDSCYRFSLALVFKSSSRTHNRAKAEELLKQIINEKIASELHLISLVHICDLYLIELRITNDLEVLGDIKPYIDQLVEFTEKHHAYYFLCDTFLLQARIALLTFDIKKARRFFMQAHQIAKRHDLRKHAEIILIEHEELIKQLDTWKRLKKLNAPISQRIELSQLNNQIKRIVQKSLTISTQISEETVIVHKDKKICIVCKGEVLGFSYICQCNAIYCENCARALSDLENVCWMCNTPIDRSKPVKSFLLDQVKEKPKISGKKFKNFGK